MDWGNMAAIVTGASGGIGTAVCRKLAKMEINLVLVGRREQALRDLALELCRDFGIRAVVRSGDITDISFVSTLPDASAAEFGGLDLLVNNAGMAQHSAFEGVTEEDFDRIMALNVKAPYFLCQSSLPMLRESYCGTIINIASVVAHKGYPMQSAYAASKHAILGFSKSLANEVYPNIRVHVISPGGVYTPMASLARPDLTPDMLTLPEDIADIVAFYLKHRDANAVIDEIQVHRAGKEPFA